MVGYDFEIMYKKGTTRMWWQMHSSENSEDGKALLCVILIIQPDWVVV